MSSGIWISVGDPDTGVWLDEQEATAEVVDGAVQASVGWFAPTPGFYRLGRARAKGWRKEFRIATEPIPPGRGATLDVTLTIDWPSE